MLKNIDIKKKPTKEQIEMIEKAKKRAITPDADCPEFSDAELAQFQRIAGERSRARKKQTVSIRLSPQALRRAKSLGKGYTSVLSRIIEETLEDPEKIKQHL